VKIHHRLCKESAETEGNRRSNHNLEDRMNDCQSHERSSHGDNNDNDSSVGGNGGEGDDSL
jgi:hypothetical protein